MDFDSLDAEEAIRQQEERELQEAKPSCRVEDQAFIDETLQCWHENGQQQPVGAAVKHGSISSDSLSHGLQFTSDSAGNQHVANIIRTSGLHAAPTKEMEHKKTIEEDTKKKKADKKKATIPQQQFSNVHRSCEEDDLQDEVPVCANNDVSSQDTQDLEETMESFARNVMLRVKSAYRERVQEDTTAIVLAEPSREVKPRSRPAAHREPPVMHNTQANGSSFPAAELQFQCTALETFKVKCRAVLVRASPVLTAEVVGWLSEGQTVHGQEKAGWLYLDAASVHGVAPLHETKRGHLHDHARGHCEHWVLINGRKCGFGDLLQRELPAAGSPGYETTGVDAHEVQESAQLMPRASEPSKLSQTGKISSKASANVCVFTVIHRMVLARGGRSIRAPVVGCVLRGQRLQGCVEVGWLHLDDASSSMVQPVGREGTSLLIESIPGNPIWVLISGRQQGFGDLLQLHTVFTPTTLEDSTQLGCILTDQNLASKDREEKNAREEESQEDEDEEKQRLATARGVFAYACKRGWRKEWSDNALSALKSATQAGDVEMLSKALFNAEAFGLTETHAYQVANEALRELQNDSTDKQRCKMRGRISRACDLGSTSELDECVRLCSEAGWSEELVQAEGAIANLADTASEVDAEQRAALQQLADAATSGDLASVRAAKKRAQAAGATKKDIARVYALHTHT